MSKKQPPIITYKGRSLGIVILTAAQLLIGAIHAFFGALLFAGENLSGLPATAAYDIYTFVFGALTLVFAVLIWQGKKSGWVGMVAVSLFVIAGDSLVVLNLPSVPGIPKFPAYTEIPYSILVVYYLSLKHVRAKFLK